MSTSLCFEQEEPMPRRSAALARCFWFLPTSLPLLLLSMGCSQQNNVRYFAVADISPSTQPSSDADDISETMADPSISIKFYRVTISSGALFEQTNLQTGFYPATALHDLYGDVSQSNTNGGSEDGSSESNTFQIAFDPGSRTYSAVSPRSRYTIVYGANAQAISNQINAFANSAQAGQVLGDLFGAAIGGKALAAVKAAQGKSSALQKEVSGLAKSFHTIAAGIEKLAPSGPGIKINAADPAKPGQLAVLWVDPAAKEPPQLKAVAGGTPAPSVQWLVSDDGGATFDSKSPIGAGSDLIIGQPFDGRVYEAVATNVNGSTTSNPVQVLLKKRPDKVGIAITSTAGTAASPAMIGNQVTLKATQEGAAPDPKIQWQSRDKGGAFVDLAGETGPTYTFVVTKDTPKDRAYRAVFSNVAAADINTSEISAAFKDGAAPPVSLSAPKIVAPQSVKAGEILDIAATVDSTVPFTVQWQVSHNGGKFSNVPEASGLLLRLRPSLDENGDSYRAVAKNDQKPPTVLESQPITLSVTGTPVVTVNPQAQTIDPGKIAEFKADASGGSDMTVQWHTVTSDNKNPAVTGGASKTLKVTADEKSSGTQYYAVFASGKAPTTTPAPGTASASASAPLVVSSAAKLDQSEKDSINKDLLQAAQAAAKALGNKTDFGNDPKTAFTTAKAVYDALNSQK